MAFFDIFKKKLAGILNMLSSKEEKQMKITGTKWYVDIEYNENIARFNGELCIDGFCARGDSVAWLKHKGIADDNERLKLIKNVIEYSRKNKFKVYFIHEDGSNY